MSVADVIAIVGILVPVLLTILGGVWFLSSRIEKIKITSDFMLQQMKDHSAEDTRRFDELFRQSRILAEEHFKLADQNFWVAANNGHGKASKIGQG